ncbi:DUF3515 domain-containing protein [Aldersonia kunmingensis]|uniref:DUF3515 domain-containing protein n=1 Tax=Aldersonia kunmingensis TaxID=408066 RepID=UPI000A777BC0|nr:DUF3515 domain-containing protein [Aldersonia kunmingensis]
MTESESPRHHPALIALAVALPVALVVGIIVAAVLANRNPEQAPVSLTTVPAPQADSPDCTELLAALPDELGAYSVAELVEPAPPATQAWTGEDNNDLVVLRCGLDRPLEFNAAAALQLVNGVQWFQVTDPGGEAASSTWYVVDRGVYIALTVPPGSGPTPVQDISNTVAETLPAKPIDPAPIPN